MADQWERRMATVERSAAQAWRAEKALRSSGAVLENLSLGVTVTDPGGTIIYVNPADARMHGHAVEELVGRDVGIYAPPSRRCPLTLDALRELRSWERESVNVRRDGGEFPVQLTSRVITDDGGEPVAVVTVCQDITERKRAEETLQATLRRGQRMEVMGRLAAGVAHDFNNLLTAILGYAQLVSLDLASGDPGRAELKEIQRVAERGAALTRQLLGLCRGGAGHPVVLDLNALVTDMERMLRRLMGEDIEFITALAADLGHVRADPVQLGQVILNLAVNARDAMPHRGRFAVRTANVELGRPDTAGEWRVAAGPYVMLAVADTGIGMDAETRSRIFEPFFTTKPRGQGTGLGLSMVSEIVRESGGDVTVHSEPGGGATFTIYLPRIEGGAVRREPEAADGALPAGSEGILVVEDDDMVRHAAGQNLRRCGYAVLEAREAVEALEICERHGGPIDLLVTDVVMPRTSGPELAERIALLRPGIRVLYMSGYPDDVIARHGLQQSNGEILRKPISPHAFAVKVRELLDAARR